MHRPNPAHGVVALCSLVLGACTDDATSTRSHSLAEARVTSSGEGARERLEATWPIVSRFTGAAVGHPPTPLADGSFMLDDPQGALAAALDPTAGLLTLRAKSWSVGVRRAPQSPAVATIAGDALVVSAASGDAVFGSSARGIEELAELRDEDGALTYRFELPAGFSLTHDGAAGITVSDGRGTPALRAMFYSGWDASGTRFSPALSLVEDEVQVTVPSDRGLVCPCLIDPEFVIAAAPAYPRTYGVLTLLPDGRVLATGGYTLGDAPNELYDPDQAVFRTLGDPRPPRQGHSATLMRDGRVLVVGGTVPDQDPGTLDEPVAAVERVDPSTGAVELLGSLPAPRAGHTATRLLDGSVLVVGGEQLGNGNGQPWEALGDAYRIAEDGSVQTVGSLAMPRGYHTASRLPDGRVAIAGGRAWPSNPDQVPLVRTSVEVFDPTTNTFSLAPESMAAARAEHTATVWDDGRLWLGWGNSAYACNASWETWTIDPLVPSQLTTTDQAIGFQFCVSPGEPSLQLPEGDMLVGSYSVKQSGEFGYGAPGGSGVGVSYAPLAEGGVLAMGQGVSSILGLREPGGEIVKGELTDERRRLVVAPLADGRLLWIGGRQPDPDVEVGEEDPPVWRYLRSAVLFDPISGAEGTTLAMTKARVGHTATRLADGRVLVVGGSNDLGEDDRPTELFDPATEGFAMGPALTIAREGHTATRLADGRVLIVGGTLEDRHAELFDPETNDLDLTGELAQARVSHSAVRLEDGRVVILGGSVAKDTPTATVEVFDPTTGEFSVLGSLLTPRADHASVLLPNGKIWVAAGSSFGTLGGCIGCPTDTAELFDPIDGSASSTFADINAVTPASALLLPNGDIHLQHSITRATALSATGDVLLMGGEWAPPGPKPPKKGGWGREWIRVGRPHLSGAPRITAYPPFVTVGASVTLHGEGFVGPTEGASGDTRQSAGDVPIVEWMPIDGGPGIRGGASNWTDTELTWTVPQTAFHGPGYLWVVTRGKRSGGALVRVARADDGRACSLDLQCGSGVCSGGVCCDRACDGCEACDAATKGFGVDGVCEPLALGASPSSAEACGVEPVSTCGRTGFCDGLGACQAYPEGTACLAGAACQLGACTVLEAQCDGDHRIVKGEASLGDCAPFRCSMEDNACLETCSSNLDCVAGLVCDEGGACVVPFGAPTVTTTSCGTGGSAPAPGGWGAGVALALVATLRRRLTQ